MIFKRSNGPFYAGFNAFETDANIFILFNDNPRNEEIVRSGQGESCTTIFDKSAFLYLLTNKQESLHETKLSVIHQSPQLCHDSALLSATKFIL